jgi:hypothetical protein
MARRSNDITNLSGKMGKMEENTALRIYAGCLISAADG